MSTINVTLKDLAQQYPVYTKKGTPWPKRIDWTHIEVEGNIIVTHFGTFTFLKAQRINKMWYWVLKDEEGKVFKITRRQARENKKMPKNRQALSIEQPQDIVIPNVLCLPEPKEYIDRLIDELNYYVKENNKKAKNLLETMTTYEETMEMWSTLSPFAIKIQFLSDASEDLNRHKEIYRILVNAYHPDKTKQNTHDKFAYIKMIFKGENNYQQGSQSKNTPPKAKPKEEKPKQPTQDKPQTKATQDKGKSQNKSQKIAMYKDSELIKTFNNIKEAKQYFGLANNNNAIYKVLTGRSKAYKGYTFSYID